MLSTGPSYGWKYTNIAKISALRRQVHTASGTHRTRQWYHPPGRMSTGKPNSCFNMHQGKEERLLKNHHRLTERPQGGEQTGKKEIARFQHGPPGVGVPGQLVPVEALKQPQVQLDR